MVAPLLPAIIFNHFAQRFLRIFSIPLTVRHAWSLVHGTCRKLMLPV